METAAGGAPPSADSASAGNKSAGATERKVEETDLYRYDKDSRRLYYLNSYRGLLVFDMSQVDAPRLLGRSPIYGSPVEMIVRNGVATVVVADWYGTMEDGKPFHGSVVRGLDARDPTNIKTLGEAKLGGWVRDTRVVGDVLYAVSEDYGWSYAYDELGGPRQASTPKIVVSSVSFGNGNIKAAGQLDFPGYGGIFHVTRDSILLARTVPSNPAEPWRSSNTTELQHIDISDAEGTIRLRGKVTVRGNVQSWGADNGRWNLDFADGKTAHILGCGAQYCGGNMGSYVLATADFSNPDAPTIQSEVDVPSTGWGFSTRFDGNKMYLASDSTWGENRATPVRIYDLSNPKAPTLAGSTDISGNVWLFMPSGPRLFALGNDYVTTPEGSYASSEIALRYLDVADITKPKLLGEAKFGEGWAWTPAAGTFKAFTKDDEKGLVVLPFSGWSYATRAYNNGVQIIQFTDGSIRTAGMANTRGWVERGIFVDSRIVALSDLSLSVVDFGNIDQPRVTAEVALARNVIDARPRGSTTALVSTDWWGNDTSYSELRIVPTAEVEENRTLTADQVQEMKLEGSNARTFNHGNFTYVVTEVPLEVPCADQGSGGDVGVGPKPVPSGGGDPNPGSEPKCTVIVPQVHVVDLGETKGRIRGKLTLPAPAWGGYQSFAYGFRGCFWYDWFDGSSVVQVGGDALAFRRWSYRWNPKSQRSESDSSLIVVDLKNPDAPSVASFSVLEDPTAWWGNLHAAGNRLYVSQYDWVPVTVTGNQVVESRVRYFLSEIDISDRAHPKMGRKTNVPGIYVGASDSDANEVYTVDYRWESGKNVNAFNVLRLDNEGAELLSSTELNGYVGNVFIRDRKAYFSAQRYDGDGASPGSGPAIQLHELDLSNPKKPIDRVATDRKGWGWLLGVIGDRAIVTSGWGSDGMDVFKIQPNGAPIFDRFVRTRGYWASSLAREENSLFVSSGYWGVERVELK